MLASAVNAQSARAGISAIRRGTANVTALSGSNGDQLRLVRLLWDHIVGGASVLAGSLNAESASASIGTVGGGGACVTALSSLNDLSEGVRRDEALIHASVLADAVDAQSAVTGRGAVT